MHPPAAAVQRSMCHRLIHTTAKEKRSVQGSAKTVLFSTCNPDAI